MYRAKTEKMRIKAVAFGFLLAVFAAVGSLAAVPAQAASTTFTVDSTADTNLTACTAAADDCTLRGAINNANGNANPADVDTINFNIPGTGVQTISPTSVLPVITGAVTIDGYSQPGSSPNNLATGNDAVLLIELDGTNAGGLNDDGIEITGSNSVVKGLVINDWSSDGVVLDGANGNNIEGNFIGTDPTGTQDSGNDFNGVTMKAGASNNVVGGTSAAARNVISGNASSGVGFFSASTSGNRIEGNHIGTNASGTEPLGNGGDGVNFLSAANNVVGGASAGARNVISGNGQGGVDVTNPDATGNRILRNSIFDNVELGIDLNAGTVNGVTPNDPDDTDTNEPNRLQNFPVITSATTNSGSTTIEGTLNSTANDTFTLQFFASPAADPSGFGEGQTFAGQTNVITNAGGNTTFSFTSATPLSGGQVVTATATNTVTDDTSEFSRAVEVEDNTPPPSQCSDSLDNDTDGKVDFGGANGDPGCESASDDSESPDPPVSPPGCTIVGTTGDDALSGSSANDTICGLGGDDQISAGSGDDTIKGGDDDDTISGDSGNDTLQGEAGDDNARGGAGSDSLSGGEGSDNLRGEAGNDALNARDGVRGNDTANGGAGRDTCSADTRDRKVGCER